MGKYSDYTEGAIGMEGSDDWPFHWTEECDASFKEYKKQIDAGKTVDADALLAKQKKIFSKMSKAEKERCNVDVSLSPKTAKAKPKAKTKAKTKKSALSQLHQFLKKMFKW